MRSYLLFVLAWLPLGACADEFTFSGEPVAVPARLAWGDPSSVPASTGHLRVASYNIENFTDADHDGLDRTEARRDAQARGVAALLDRIDPDVVVFMEIENAAVLRTLNDFLARPFPLAYITLFENEKGFPEKLNLAIFSRIALEEVTELDFGSLAGPGRPTRGLLRAVTSLEEGRRLAIYAVHLKSNYGYRPRNEAKRNHALSLLAKDAQQLAATQPDTAWEVLVAGDMNVDPELPEFAQDTSLNPLKAWRDLWHGVPQHERATVPTRVGDPEREFPPACFDRLIVSPALAEAPWTAGKPAVIQEGVSLSSESIPGEQGHVSDHFPVWVDLTR